MQLLGTTFVLQVAGHRPCFSTSGAQTIPAAETLRIRFDRALERHTG
jgi:hypothetical protein